MYSDRSLTSWSTLSITASRIPSAHIIRAPSHCGWWIRICSDARLTGMPARWSRIHISAKILSMKRSSRVSFVSQCTTSLSEYAVTGSMCDGASIACSWCPDGRYRICRVPARRRQWQSAADSLPAQGPSGRRCNELAGPGEKQLQDRGTVCLVVCDDQVKCRYFSLHRTGGYRPGQIPRRVGRQQHDAACRCNHRYRMDDIVHFMFRLEIDTGAVEILQNDTAHRGGGFGRKIKSFVRDIPRRDGRLRCQAMVAR